MTNKVWNPTSFHYTRFTVGIRYSIDDPISSILYPIYSCIMEASRIPYSSFLMLNLMQSM